MRRLLLMLGLLVGLASPVAAATRYVAITGGSDATSCANSVNIGTPKQHLTGTNGALNCMSGGDTLLVRAGDYYEWIYDGDATHDIPGGTAGAYTRIAAYPGETVTLKYIEQTMADDEEYLMFFGYSSTSKYIEFDGINMDSRGSPWRNQYVPLFIKCFSSVLGGHHIRMQNATIWGAPGKPNDINIPQGYFGASLFQVHAEIADHVACPGGSEFINLTMIAQDDQVMNPATDRGISSYAFYITATETLIDHLDTSHNRYIAIQIAADGAPNGYIGRTVVRNSVFHDSHVTSSIAGGGYTTGVLMGGGSTGAEIYNNVFYNNGTTPGSYSSDIFEFGGLNSQVYNNTMYGNADLGIRYGIYSYGGLVLRNNIVYGAPTALSVETTAGYTASNNMFIGTDPQFVNVGANNFHLALGSPAIDVGMCLASVPTDADGVTRPQGTGCDIGGYEFIPGGGGTPPGPVVGLVPAHNATGIDLFPTLSWTAATGATNYDLFGPSLFNGQSAALLTELWTIGDTTDIGAQWTPYVIGYTNAQVVTQHVRTTTTAAQSVERASVAVATDQWVRIRLTTMGTGAIGAGVLLRAQNSAQFNGYMAGATTGYGTYRTWIWRYDAGAAILLASEDTTPWASNDLLEAHIVGNVITVFRNGNTDLRLTGPADNTYTAGFVGLHLFSNVAIGQVEIDNFEAGSIGPTYTLSQAGTSYPAVSLSPATVYYWKVIARNAFGSSDSGVVQFTTTGTTATPVGIRVRFKCPNPGCP